MKNRRLMRLCTFLLLLLPPLTSADMQKVRRSQIELRQEKTPFTVGASLALECLNDWSYPRFASFKDTVAYAVIDGYYERSPEEEAGRFFVPKGSHIFIQSFREGRPFQLTQGSEYSWSPSWSPDGDRLAFYVLAQNRVQIGVWNRVARKSEYVDPGGLFGRGSIEWDPAGHRIYFSANPQGWQGRPDPYEPSENPIIRTTWQKVNPYDERLLTASLSQLTCYDLDRKTTAKVSPRLMISVSKKFSPDGKYVALLELVKHKIRVLDTTDCDFIVFPLDGGEPKTVVTNSQMTQYSWSSDSRLLAYVDKGELFIYSPVGDKSTQLSHEGLLVTGNPIWLKGDERVFCASANGYYQIQVRTGKAESVGINLPNALVTVFPDRQKRSLYFAIADDASGKQGLYRVSLKDYRADQLFLGDGMIKDISPTDGGVLFTKQNALTPENIWFWNAQERRERKITDINGNASTFAFGKTELISWTSQTGKHLKGVLLYPANYEFGQRYPVVFWVYETFSSQLHHFFLHLYNLQVLANQGYAVFLPDVDFVLGDTSQSYVRSIEPAMDRLIELGLADGNFGVMGHSYGGYATNAIVTHSKRFKAAVAISGISDWVSFHGLPGDYMRLSNEKGQGRMGGDLREFPERYVKNSPVFFLNNVETPLMILHGTRDYGVPFSQAEEMYYGLRHLGKVAVLIGYPGEDHLYWGTKINVLKDMWIRILSWFDKYLK